MVIMPLQSNPRGKTPPGRDRTTIDDSIGVSGIVMVVQLRLRTQARCTCGWIGKARMSLSSAKLDALLHAARGDCEPATPLFQPGIVMRFKPPTS